MTNPPPSSTHVWIPAKELGQLKDERDKLARELRDNRYLDDEVDKLRKENVRLKRMLNDAVSGAVSIERRMNDFVKRLMLESITNEEH